MEQSQIAIKGFLIAHKKLAESVEPRMSHLNNPSAMLRGTSRFPSLAAYPWKVATSTNRPLGWFTIVPSVSIEVRPYPSR